MKRLTALLLCLFLMLGTAASAEEPELDENGFLVHGDNGAEYILEDEENGVWQYASDSLSIRINRYRETKKIKNKKKTLEYCIAEIRATEASPLTPVMTDATKKRVAGYKLVSPEILIEKYNPVFALSDDMYGIRLQQYKYYGIVIRNGEVMARKTRNSQKSRAWPNLDTLALYGDGSMKTFVCDELTPEEYLEQGATQVFSFGPWLIRNGEINPDVLKDDYYPYNYSRVAIGMIEPYHYIAIAVKEEPKDKYVGVHLDWLAEKMQELGCTEALNLDGGGTTTLAFNGKILLTGKAALRSQGSMICFGVRNLPAEQ